MALDKLGESLSGVIRKITMAGLVDENLVKEVVKDIQRALLSSDVNVKLVMELSKKIQERSLKEKPKPGLGKKEHVISIVYEELVGILQKDAGYTLPQKSRIMMAGLQGSGKTTTTVKLAKYFSKRGLHTFLIGADTYRPAAFEQMRQLAEPLNISVYGNPEEKDPRKIVEAALEKAKKADIIILDTAGRHRSEDELIKEMEDLAEIFHPDERYLVIDSNLGQQAGAQAAAFHKSIGITGVILTKLDGSAKGGGALSAVAETSSPIRFIGTGERMDNLELFDADRFISRLLGMGDLKSLMEKAKETIDEKKVKDIFKGNFTLDDLKDQISSLRNMGPLGNVLKMIPGMGFSVPQEATDMTEDKMDGFLVIIDSINKKERENPKMINSSRAKRIARGAGRTAEEVKELLKYYTVMKKAIKGFKKGGLGGKKGFSPASMGKLFKNFKM